MYARIAWVSFWGKEWSISEYVFLSQNGSHQGYIFFLQILIPNRLLISPVVPCRICRSAKMVLLRLCYMFFTTFVPPSVYVCQIWVPNSLLMYPMVPLRVCILAKMLPLRICFWEKLVPLSVQFYFYKTGPTKVNVFWLQP